MHSSRSATRLEETAGAASEITELLEVLWGRGRDDAAAPVSASQLRVLFILADNEGINLRTLSAALGSAPPSVSRLCDRLQAVGFLERDPNPASRREVRLRLSGRGEAFLNELRDRRREQLSQVLATMPPSARTELLSGLRAFRDAAGPGTSLRAALDVSAVSAHIA
ncbi:MarR family transcriptional regulator [Streptomyces sp. H10-C2]|uniref:MarR family winged helix-turn-helix transcriptional regulator n=1 Tax=unclassified Streptomyces TaxID=2593676 RepID=UPI0024B9791D|nr:MULTISPECIES: MarR family transcriptional regulator [unclassified Streptomyces]MDJ0343562.1 MarR family transcriptional regulator [Streptomyces sp. PH10-H1]MDJ0368862.1 MarR family transcriptional regulator [Streptomyces sp. H10-C2]